MMSAPNKKTYQRKVAHVPPEERPRWVNSSDLDGSLVLLAWGDRFLGKEPIPVYLHDSWSYTVILKGLSVLKIGEAEHPIRPGEAVLVGPDCPMGWIGKSTKARSTILGWSWRRTPFFLGPESQSSWYRVRMPRESVSRLQDLHRRCRQEVELSDCATSPALDALRTLIDTEFCRCLKTKRTQTDDSLRFQLATRWMAQHLDADKPIQKLCEYLQVSPATLKLLFHRKSKASPFDGFQKLKFAQAKRLLQERDTSIKSVALTLGYQHSSHFSRAFAAYTGTPPKRARVQPKMANKPELSGK